MDHEILKAREESETGPPARGAARGAVAPARNRMAVALLSLAGFFVALYMLVYALGWTGPLVCGLGECEKVQASPYSSIGPVPVAAFGVVGYGGLVALALLGLQGGRWAERKVISVGLLGGSIIGVSFSAYLTYLEAFVIRAWCQWCVVSAILIVLVFLASLPELRRMREDSHGD